MLRLLVITDLDGYFPSKLLQGIVRYSTSLREQWSICRMPTAYKNRIGIPGVVKWAREWGANAVIGPFDETDDLPLFAESGIIAVALDFKKRFKDISNITGDYGGNGRMAARYFIEHGFKNFGFFGFEDLYWSEERCEGFRRAIEEAGFGDSLYIYNTTRDNEKLWYDERIKLSSWLRKIPKPIAIMACNDVQGNNLIEACHLAGIKVPTEVAVLGVNNDEMICNMGSCTLSSIQIDIEGGGYKAAQNIERMVAAPRAKTEDVVLQTVRIAERMSTAGYATGDDQIRKALLFIHHNKLRKISVLDVMDEVALSRRLLEKRFRNVTGQSIYQYISSLRIRHFAHLLQDTDESITEIALSLGESDTKSISRRFKQLYGCSPQEWRDKTTPNPGR